MVPRKSTAAPSALQWVELDVWGRSTGETFAGDVDALRAHLLELHAPNGKVSNPTVVDLFLNRVDNYIAERVRATLITLRLPWGTYRWIPRPVPHPRRP